MAEKTVVFTDGIWTVALLELGCFCHRHVVHLRLDLWAWRTSEVLSDQRVAQLQFDIEE